MSKDDRITIMDVARAANVSRALVSFVLNGREDVAPSTRARILQAIEELGYRPNAVARNLAMKRAGAIGIVCDMETYQDPLDMQFLAAILTTASAMGQRVMLIPPDDQQIREMVQDHAVDGIIFLDELVSDPRITHLLATGFPSAGLWGDGLDIILREGFEQLALHLESRGHQRVVCFCGPDEKLLVTRFEQMLTETLQVQGIAVLVYRCSTETETAVAHQIARELKRNHATVIATSSDKLSITAIHALRAAQLRIPEDCAVTGFGDVPAAQWVQPTLTTIQVPVKAMAAWAVAKVFKGEAPGTQRMLHSTVSSRLIIRRSC